jgi:glycosyltransferase involved in cell wall biosynthesis
MRFLLVIPNINSYRAFLGELCSELNANYAQVHLACSIEGMMGQNASGQDSCVHFHPLRLPRGMNPIAHLKAARELDALVSQLRPDIIDAHFSAAIFTTALARRSSWPVTLGTFHGLSFPLVNGIKGRLLRTAESWAAGRFDSVCVLTQDDRKRLHEVAPGATVKVPYSSGVGCDLHNLSLDRVPASERQSLRKRLRIEPDDRVFIFVGRFVAFKGFDLTVRTFLQIAETDPQLRLLLVGARDPVHPSGLTSAEDRARKNCPQIIDVGWTADVASYLAISDVLVFPSRREGMPVCLMGALAMGVPVITCASRGCRDVVRHGRDGLVLRDCTADTLGTAMKRLAQDDGLRARFSAEALAGRQRFDRRIFIREQIDLYRQHAACMSPRLGGSPMAPAQFRTLAPYLSGPRDPMSAVRLAHVTTVDLSLRDLLLNQLVSLKATGYDVTGISAPGTAVAALESANIRHISVPMTRKVTPLADLASLWHLYRIMRRGRFTIVHAHTPKAGLLGQLAARLAGVPVIVNTVHGFYFHEQMHPIARHFYIILEKVAARCSDLILSQNAEDFETALREGICRPEKVKVLGNGIDLTQFNPERISAEEQVECRQKLGIAAGAPVVGFVGRLAGRRKGFLDFLAAAKNIAEQQPDVLFLIVGDEDRGKNDAVDPSAATGFGITDRCLFLGYRSNAEMPALYKIMNVLVLPSLFEGVPRVVMEASAMGTPCVVTDVKGNREAVAHDRNGLLVPLGDVRTLTAAVLRILRERDTAQRMGSEGRRIAVERFDEQLVFQKIKAEYGRLLHKKGLPLPAGCSTERAALRFTG